MPNGSKVNSGAPICTGGVENVRCVKVDMLSQVLSWNWQPAAFMLKSNTVMHSFPRKVSPLLPAGILVWLSGSMNEKPLLASDFRAYGIDSGAVARLVRSGALQRVRRGGYVDEVATNERQRHLQLVATTVPLVGLSTVVSHWSAGAVHGLPLWGTDLEKVSVTRPPASHGNRDRWVHSRACPLPPDDVEVVDGWRVTTLARTAVDLARTFEFERGVAVMDAALRLGGPREDVLALIADTPRRPGIVRARRVGAFADPLSESVGESKSRVVFDRWGIPQPVLQLEVCSRGGAFIGRSDFGWPEFGVLGEFDGMIKYSGRLDLGMSGAEAIAREKQREAALRDLGWIVVRWMWDDLANPAQLVRRLNVAFSQGRTLRLAG